MNKERQEVSDNDPHAGLCLSMWLIGINTQSCTRVYSHIELILFIFNLLIYIYSLWYVIDSDRKIKLTCFSRTYRAILGMICSTHISCPPCTAALHHPLFFIPLSVRHTLYVIAFVIAAGRERKKETRQPCDEKNMSAVKRSKSPDAVVRDAAVAPARGRSISRTRSGKRKAASRSPSTTSTIPTTTSAGALLPHLELFKQIDVDNSGYIDAVELMSLVAKSFPKARITPAIIQKLLLEADANHDGVISYKEFVDVLDKAEEKHAIWAKLSTWSRVQYELDEVFAVADGALEPLRRFSREHSVDLLLQGKKVRTPSEDSVQSSSDGSTDEIVVQQASISLRFLSFILSVVWAALVYHITYGLIYYTGDHAVLPDLWLYCPYFLLFYELTAYADGQDFSLYLLGLQIVDRYTGKPFSFLETLAWTTLSRYVFVWFDWLVLLLTDGTSLDYLMGALVVVKPTHRPILSSGALPLYAFMIVWIFLFKYFDVAVSNFLAQYNW
jgi:EF-hand domain pair